MAHDVPAASPALPPPPARAACANCGRAVDGRYCSACGQEAGRDPRSLSTLLETRADHRAARTLSALLLRPGLLTVAYLADHRARYLPPVRVYLVASVVFFALALTPPSGSRGAWILDVPPPDAARVDGRARAVGDAPAAGEAPVLAAASPLADGAILRIAARSVEAGMAALRAHLAFLATPLDGDPLLRRP